MCSLHAGCAQVGQVGQCPQLRASCAPIASTASNLLLSKRIRILGMQIPEFCTQTYVQNRENSIFHVKSCVIVNISFLPSVSKLKPTSPCCLPYPDVYPGVVVPCVDPASSGKNLPAFSQHLAAFGGQMRNPRTITCSV